MLFSTLVDYSPGPYYFSGIVFGGKIYAGTHGIAAITSYPPENTQIPLGETAFEFCSHGGELYTNVETGGDVYKLVAGTWTYVGTAPVGWAHSLGMVSFGSYMYMVVGEFSGVYPVRNGLVRSTDGVTWTEVFTTDTLCFRVFTYGGKLYYAGTLAVPDYRLGNWAIGYESTDGVNFVASPMLNLGVFSQFMGEYIDSVTGYLWFGTGSWYAAENGPARLWYSPDGINKYQAIEDPNVRRFSSIVRIGGTLYAIADNGYEAYSGYSRMYISTNNGVSWSYEGDYSNMPCATKLLNYGGYLIMVGGLSGTYGRILISGLLATTPPPTTTLTTEVPTTGPPTTAAPPEHYVEIKEYEEFFPPVPSNEGTIVQSTNLGTYVQNHWDLPPKFIAVGTDGYLDIYQNWHRAFKDFPISKLGGKVIVSASLNYYLNQVYQGDYITAYPGALNVSLHRVSDYGTLDVTDYDIATLHNFGVVGNELTPAGWKTIDITDQLQIATDNLESSFSIRFVGDKEVYDYQRTFWMLASALYIPAYLSVVYGVIPAAPIGVVATKYQNDRVTITWNKSTDATGYRVYRDGVNIYGTLGDVNTLDDFGTAAPVITPGTATASDGSSAAHVELVLTGCSIANGTTHTYTVVAVNAYGESAPSSSDTGYRLAGTRSYQWKRSATDNPADPNFSIIAGATSTSHNDTEAPAEGVGRYFKCQISAPGSVTVHSTSDRGYRLVTVPTNVQATENSTAQVVITWTKVTGATNYRVYRNGIDISGLLGDVATYTDTTGDPPVITPGYAAASDGLYSDHVEVGVTGESVANGTAYNYTVAAVLGGTLGAQSVGDIGRRIASTLTYQWQRSAADSDATYSDLVGEVTKAITDVIPDEYGRYYKCVIDSTDAVQAISTSDRGFQTYGWETQPPASIYIRIRGIWTNFPPDPINHNLDKLFNLEELLGDNWTVNISAHGNMLNVTIVPLHNEVTVTVLAEGDEFVGGVWDKGDIPDIAISIVSGVMFTLGRNNLVMWSKIGHMQFEIDQSNEAGNRRMDWGGGIHAIAKLLGKVIVYGDNGVSILTPSGVNWGMETIDRVGVKNKGAVAGDEYVNFYVDKQSRLCMLTNKLFMLDYSEFLSAMGTIILSYDKVKELLYICDGTYGYVYSAKNESFGEGPVDITGLDSRDGIIYVASPAALTVPKFEICTDIFDFKTRKNKTVEALEIGTDKPNDLFSSIDYRTSYKDDFRQLGWFLVNPDGKSYPKCYGVEFRFRLRSLVKEDFEVDYIKVYGRVHGFSSLDISDSANSLLSNVLTKSGREIG